MVRALVFATLAVVISQATASQTLGVLHIKVVLLDADRKLTPVPHHALLVSANPAIATIPTPRPSATRPAVRRDDVSMASSRRPS